jgi:hypothetical protein
MKKTKLKDLSCSQLAEILASEPAENEGAQFSRMRGRLTPKDLERLKSLGDEPARDRAAKLQIAANFEKLPAIQQ